MNLHVIIHKHLFGFWLLGSRFVTCSLCRNSFPCCYFRLQRSISPVISFLIVLPLDSGYAFWSTDIKDLPCRLIARFAASILWEFCVLLATTARSVSFELNVLTTVCLLSCGRIELQRNLCRCLFLSSLLHPKGVWNLKFEYIAEL